VYVQSRDEIVAKIGRSPDYASAFILALIDTPRRNQLAVAHTNARARHDPYKFR
jgi:hypothetical protein